MLFRIASVLSVALLSAGCSTMAEPDTTSFNDDEDRGFFSSLSMPSMPSLPTVNISNISIPGTNRAAPEVDPDLESVIYWRVIADDILVVHANTNGCTARSDFTVNVEQYHDNIYSVRLNRDDEDRCSEEMPWGIQLGFGFEELGVPIGGQIIVLNPLDERPWDWDERAPHTVNARR